MIVRRWNWAEGIFFVYFFFSFILDDRNTLSLFLLDASASKYIHIYIYIYIYIKQKQKQEDLFGQCLQRKYGGATEFT